jgi:hypothetical protein
MDLWCNHLQNLVRLEVECVLGPSETFGQQGKLRIGRSQIADGVPK